MITRASAALLRAAAWCLLLAALLTAMEALGALLHPNMSLHNEPLVFWQLLANSCAVFFAVTLACWTICWMLIVWMGGARPGIAFFFMALFLTLLLYLNIVLDWVFAYTPKYIDRRLELLWYAGYFAFFAAALISLLIAKITRRRHPCVITLRPALLLDALMLSWAIALFHRTMSDASLSGALYWGALFAVLLGLCALLWFALKNRVVRSLCTLVLAMAILTPCALDLPSSDAVAPTATAPTQPKPTTPPAIRQVILITIDTLRQDALGCFHPESSLSPNIDQFAADCAVFRQAYSSAPWTYPSVTSILTGLPPQVHQLVDGKCALPENVPTLAQALHQAGYHTAALGFNSVLAPRSRLNRGFNEYHWYPRQTINLPNFGVGIVHKTVSLYPDQTPNTTQLVDEAIQWLDNHRQNQFFFWFHCFDPHIAYAPPEEFLPQDPALREQGPLFSNYRAARAGTIARTPEERAWIRALYDGEVRHVDEQMGRLFAALRESGVYQDALILLTADHGEEFWDHDHFEHGHTLYNELIRVPLLVKLPGNAAPGPVDAPVTNQAIAPTILDLCGIPAPQGDYLLPPLSPLLRNTPDAYAVQPIFSGANIFYGRLESVLFDGKKYIVSPLSGREELYDLVQDPRERHSIAAQDPVSLEQGRRWLEEERNRADRLKEQLNIQQDARDAFQHEEIQSLQALGYF